MGEPNQTTTDAAGATAPAASPPAAEPAATAPTEATALAEKTAEAERLQDRLRRLQAEFENSKKRVARERADFLKFATEELLLKFLPVLDNLERAVASTPTEGPCAPFREGVDMTARLFRTTLERAGVTPVTAVGEPFDPSRHQAVAHVEAPGVPENQVVEEVQKGYLLEGRVLRPAMVKVSRAGADGSAAAEGPAA
jgi:molecular chaperone GrpE